MRHTIFAALLLLAQTTSVRPQDFVNGVRLVASPRPASPDEGTFYLDADHTIYRYDGSAWQIDGVAPVTAIGSAANVGSGEDDLLSVTVPSRATALRVTAFVEYAVNSNTKTVVGYLGGHKFMSHSAQSAGSVIYQFLIVKAVNGNGYSRKMTGNGSAFDVVPFTPTTLKFTGESTEGGSGDVTQTALIVEVLR